MLVSYFYSLVNFFNHGNRTSQVTEDNRKNLHAVKRGFQECSFVLLLLDPGADLVGVGDSEFYGPNFPCQSDSECAMSAKSRLPPPKKTYKKTYIHTQDLTYCCRISPISPCDVLFEMPQVQGDILVTIGYKQHSFCSRI